MPNSAITLDAVTSAQDGVTIPMYGKPGAAMIEGSGFTGTWELKVKMQGMTYKSIGSGSGDDQLQIPGGWDYAMVDATAVSAGSLTARINRETNEF